MATTTQAARVEMLKHSWLADPCWDIEETEGFAWCKDELKAYRLMMEDKWQKERNAAMYAKSEQLGCPGNFALVRYIEGLERRIEELETKWYNKFDSY